MRNPYEVLGVKEGTSKEDIKKAYREQAKNITLINMVIIL